MKKKGFTLIELLAVIVVLAIIAVIATPMVLNTIEDAKKGAAKSSTMMMVDAARLYHTRQYINPLNQFEGFECSISDGNGCDELSVKGQKPDSGIISISNKGLVSGMVKFGKYTYYICNDKVSEEEMAGCSFTDYSLVYNITNEGIITGFKNKEETAFNIIEEVYASELTDEAKEVIESKTLTIPEYVGEVEVKGIGANAFASYDIEKITILTSKRITIGENAFPENLGKLKVSECSSKYYSEYEAILETFKSKCVLQEYTITYDLNGGTGDIQVQHKTEGVDVTLTATVPTKEGYNFIGWATTVDSKTAEYEAGATYSNDNDITLYAVWESYKCIRATELHSEKCSNTDTGYYCRGAGYGYGATITYGNKTVTEGKLTSGDAFTCDVNGDGTYDETTERFYYITDLSSNNEYAVLMYYNNTVNGVVNNKNAGRVAYYPTYSYNWYGPTEAKKSLPTTTQWKNVSLSNTNRAITNELGGNTSGNGKMALPNSFSYAGYAARLLTIQEVVAACSITGKLTQENGLKKCVYLLENTEFGLADGVRTSSYWLENAESINDRDAWQLRSYLAQINSDGTRYNSSVRPAIEVLKTDIDY